nr:unnamed protein product [Callosobruchus analis]
MTKEFLCQKKGHSQNQMNGLAMLAIEHEISNKLNLNRVIREFAEIKVQLPSFPCLLRAVANHDGHDDQQRHGSEYDNSVGSQMKQNTI